MCEIIRLLPLNSFTVCRRINFHSRSVSRSYVLLTFPLLSTICLEQTHFMLDYQMLRFTSKVVPHGEHSNIRYHGNEPWLTHIEASLGPTHLPWTDSVYLWQDKSHYHLHCSANISSSYTCSVTSYGMHKRTRSDRQIPSFILYCCRLFLQIQLIGLLLLLLLLLLLWLF
jgi:hypothetical protein